MPQEKKGKRDQVQLHYTHSILQVEDIDPTNGINARYPFRCL
jgi:hypothetical protein